ncbi:hypothetical protein BDR07DRAFT_1492042 [Suillus spraguei]|nr:hypothetical protein BDR07DRAFT_1492042 [Suillus spraguei]
MQEKTTILQRVCNTGEKPAIYNRARKQIEPAVLNASRERGEHDIENEMVFKSNPGFVFHDSRGFEAGGESEFDKVKDFITRRSKEPRLGNRLHAIWYCIPMDQKCRSFTAGENKFFSQCDTGTVPVIVLFTKFDALHDDAYMELISQGVPGKTASAQAPRQAKESFANGPQLKILKDLQPPKYHVCLPDMNKDGADCGPLIQCTAGTLDNDVLQQLFISTQQTNLELCMEHALRR